MEEKYISKLHPTMDYGAGGFLILIAVVSITGNAAVLVAAVKKSSRLKPPELLSVNLAVTDLGMAVSIYPLAISSAFNHSWLGGDISCIYYGLLGLFFGVASIMTLTVMAVVRLILTSTLQITANKINKREIQLAIVCIWLYALVWAILPICGCGKYGPEPFGISCTINWSEERNFKKSAFIIPFSVLCVILPTLTLISCYSAIAWKHHKAYQASKNNERILNSNTLEKKLTLMAVMVTAGFLSCWAPYAVISFWSIYNSSDNIPPEISVLPCLLAKSSTVYNPLIYYAFSKTFRREIKELKCCCLCQIQLLNHAAENELRVRWSGRNNVQIQPLSE
ncbi:opsin-5-like [Huso huso]|uniref:Opsin-5-like n=1 Tax=Huso huso TaxID=61971 RepID=A0ABR0ZUX0_HUSHU